MKAYILRIETDLSKEYAKVCADSCDRVGLDWEYHKGYQNMTGKAGWCNSGIKMKFYEPIKYLPNPTPAQKANACSAGHGAIWKRIATGSDAVGIVLEHDALMLHYPDIEIPDGVIVVLGYKIADPENYDHVTAGPPTELLPIDGHEGAHAYAMTKRTAQFLVHEIESRGVLGAVDNAYFIRGQRRTQVPLALANPTPALGWLRESTIWADSAHVNYKFTSSFEKNYKYLK
jgi:hypothetical protein